MAPDGWKIQLLGGFRVATPEGREIEIRSRKSRALVALLALNDGIAVRRESLCRDLWPGKPRANQQQSLRQALKEIKDAFEPYHVIEATHDVCRLSLDGYLCDALECLHSGRSPGKEVLLPDMPESVFDSYRSELASHAPAGGLGEAVRGAATMLEWTMLQDPARALDVLFLSRELVPYLPIKLVVDALRISLAMNLPSHPSFLWGKTQFGIALMWAGRPEEGLEVAKGAIASTEPEKESADWIAAVFTAAMFLVYRGKFERAETLLRGAMEIAQSHKLSVAIARFKHGLAHRFAYAGDFAKALELLAELSVHAESPATDAMLEVHESCYLLLADEIRSARVKLDSAKAKAGEEFDARLSSQLRVAEAYILIAENRESEAKVILEELASFTDAYGLTLVLIHAYEGLAIIEKNGTTHTEWLDRAIRLREQHRYPLLPADRIRMKSVM